MDTPSSIENLRLHLQAELDGAKTAKERNKLGQFATPSKLASDLLSYASDLLPHSARIRFLDPAIGTGSFYSALLREFSPGRIEMAKGFEIDAHYGEPARKLWQEYNLNLKLEDFTAAPSPAENERFNLVICNPPYVRHHHMTKDEKARLLVRTYAACGVQMTGLAGLYCHFLGLAHEWMAPDGIAGWLIPSEFMDVNYGQMVKWYLLNKVELLRVHRFDPSDLQFGDALVSSSVVWFRNRKPAKEHRVDLSFGGSLSAPSTLRTVAAVDLQDAPKWTGLAVNGIQAKRQGLRLSDFFDIKRGLATGDNSFFIMDREQIASRSLPIEFFRPILPGPRHLSANIVDADADGVPNVTRPLFILDCRNSESELRDSHPALWDYLQTGKPKVAETYLCSRRSPWYAQEKRPPAPFVCTYMGRGLEKREKPFRFILNRSKATAANVYLLLYPKAALARALLADAKLAEAVWKFLNGIETATLLGEGRVYGGGLYKMEPKELANVPADAIAALLEKISWPSSQSDMFANAAE